MSIIVILSAPFTYIVASFITKRSQQYFRKNANALGSLNGFSEEMLSGMKTIKAYHYEESANHTFQEMNQTLYEAGVKSQFYGSLANPSTRFVGLERRDTSSERNRINGIFKGRGRRRIPGTIAPDRLNGKDLPPHCPDACGLRTRIPGRTVLRATMARSPKAASFKRTAAKAVPLTA